MGTQQILIGIVALVIIALGGFLFLSSQQSSDSIAKDDENEMMENNAEEGDVMEKNGQGAMTPKDNTLPTGQVEKGSYEAYSPEKLALAQKGKVVLYFHADWCPICRPLDAALKSADIPSGVHILKVNYDTAGDLKQKYGVTYQHTFVQVDARGMLVAKWSDAFTAADVFGRVQ